MEQLSAAMRFGVSGESITRHQAEYRYDEGLYLRSTAILKTFAGDQL